MQIQSVASSSGLIQEAPLLTGSFGSLVDLSHAELERLFTSGAPDTLASIDGHPRGRLIASPGFERFGLPRAVVKAFAVSPLVLWQGKSFAAAPGATEGIGINRVQLFGLRGLFSFRTFVGDSIVDGKKCIAISYDVPQNPGYVRPTYDELRRVGSALYLGRGMKLRPGKSPALLVWFALDASIPDRPIRWAAGDAARAGAR